MTDSIRIDSGLKRILINDGPHYLEFNPTDVAFIERFYTLVENFEKKLIEYQDRAHEIDQDVSTNEKGLPTNLGDKLGFLNDVCTFAHEQIDHLFGAGTSMHLFGNQKSLQMVEQFFASIAPFIEASREEKVKKYVNRKGKTLK